MFSVLYGHLLLQILELLVNLPAEVNELLARALEQLEQLVDGGFQKTNSSMAGKTAARGWCGRGVILPRYSKSSSSIRPPNSASNKKSPLKSSRSRERGSAVAVGMAGGNLASGGRRSICSGSDNDGATAAVGGLRSAGGGDGPG